MIFLPQPQVGTGLSNLAWLLYHPILQTVKKKKSQTTGQIHRSLAEKTLMKEQRVFLLGPEEPVCAVSQPWHRDLQGAGCPSSVSAAL